MGVTNSLTFLTLFLSTLISAQDPSASSAAPLATDQPKRHTYQAILQISKPIQGSITGVSSDTGTGVTFNLNFNNFPDLAEFGPFAYHIHTSPVIDGNCTTAQGHLRPFNGPADNITCDATKPSFCQVGDLSGKHGKIGAAEGPSALTNGKLMQTFTDDYVNAIEGSEAFFGNRSIVVHMKNGTRLNCANFVRVSPAGYESNTATVTATAATMMPTGTSSTPTYAYSSGSGMVPTPSPFTGTAATAAQVSWGCSAILGGLTLLMAAWL